MPESRQYKEDFEFFWKTIREDYCYWDKKQTNWDSVKSFYSPKFETISSRAGFVLLLEKVFNELYDHHASLSTNIRESQRLVPSGTDIWAEFRSGKPIILELRKGFGAEKSGLREGMEIVAVNDIPVETAMLPFLPNFLKADDKEAKDYALRVLLAGKFIDNRKISARDRSGIRDYFPDQPSSLLLAEHYTGIIESKILSGNIGYIKINNNLWDNALIPVFDSVMNVLKNTSSLILDLRETPSGGNTTVARTILGSFIEKEGFYQKHELTAEERSYGTRRSWVEIVSPRKNVYKNNLVILCNHWTGSVGEGIVIGFNALGRGKIIGTPMAGLNGAIYSYQLPNTKIGFSFPVEKLMTIKGQPRENFIPPIAIDLMTQKKGEDLILKTALHHLVK